MLSLDKIRRRQQAASGKVRRRLEREQLGKVSPMASAILGVSGAMPESAKTLVTKINAMPTVEAKRGVPMTAVEKPEFTAKKKMVPGAFVVVGVLATEAVTRETAAEAAIKRAAGYQCIETTTSGKPGLL
mmetsp:Transcript_79518/g.157547  ORF Transcript_79518/g.157547 Transcript_79518/m.157547 type:complete len:130 (+) Transcript_79518:303-692(+)